MSTSHRSFLTSRTGRSLAGLTALGWVLTGPGAVGMAAAHGDSDVDIQNTETIQVYTDASGKVDTKRIYEQLVLTGNGSVDFSNPVSDDGLRNLDGFGGFDVKDGAEQVSTTVDGQKRLRSVSDFNGDLPLDVSVTYFLDGKEVAPSDIVGESGDLEVKYHVENVTGRTEQVEVSDGKGGTVTKTIDVVLPMVGSLTTVLPPNFTDVSSDQANVAGDGRGGTKMTFTMTLVPPIGGPTVDFGYQAKITDGLIPDATVSALPVSPLESTSLKTAADSYKGGSETGADLTAGAIEIDANLLKLRDGAQDLTAGLMKLYDGAGKLSEGLNNDAVPGTQQLADGSSRLADGASRLYAGSGDLVGGLHQLRDGTGDLLGGTRDLNDGALQVRDGADRLGAGATRLRHGANDLHDGAVRLRGGAADLRDGAQAANQGAVKVDRGAHRLSEGLTEAGTKAPALVDGLNQVRDGLDQVDAGLTTLYAGTQAARGQFRAGIDQLIAGIGQNGDVANPDDTVPDTLLGGLKALQYGLRSPLGIGACDQNPTDDTNGADNCGAADADQIISGKLSAGSLKIIDPANPALSDPSSPTVPTDPRTQTLLKASLGAYEYVRATSPYNAALQCPARISVPQHPLYLLPDPSALSPQMAGANPPCYAAAVAAYGYGAPHSPVLAGTPFQDGGLAAQASETSQALALVYSTLDDKALKGIVKLRCGLDNTVVTADVVPGTSCAQFNGTLPDGHGGVVTKPGLLQGINQVDGGITSLIDQVQGGVGTPGDTPADLTLRGGINGLQAGSDALIDGGSSLLAGLSLLQDGSLALADGTGRLAAGTQQLADGSVQLADGTVLLADGSRQLADGTVILSNGTRRLADGTVRLADGTEQLNDGASQLNDGAVQLDVGGMRLQVGAQKLADGSGRLDDGLQQLLAGLTDAADGSNQLRDGLQKAADGAPKISEGADKLSKKGTQKLVAAGSSTTVEFGTKYAELEAGAERAQKDGMAFGAPQGAQGLTAYTYEIRGEDGEGSRNWSRGLAGVAVFGLGAGVYAIRRRYV